MVSNPRRDRDRLLEAACGYLELNMPEHALRALKEIADPESVPYEFNLLRGEALRAADQFDAALTVYSRALLERPDDLGVLMGMAWCYKRINQLSRAIAAMEQAYRAHPKDPVVMYNLACYHSLGGDKTQSLSWLGRALRMESSLKKDSARRMESSLRKLIPDEPDFDPLRNDPDFQYLAGMGHLTDR